MTLKPILHSKRAGESYPVQVDFSPRLTGTLAAAAVSTGSTAPASGITASGAVVADNAVRFLLAGGAAGSSYDIRVIANLDNGGVIEEVLRVVVS